MTPTCVSYEEQVRGTLSPSGGEVRLGMGVGYPSWITGTVAGGTFVLTLILGPMLFAKNGT